MKNNYKPKIKKGDTVQIIAGNHKNKTGTVIALFPKEKKAKVQNIHLLTHYIKPTQAQPKGGIIQKEGTIDISNLKLIDPKTKKPTTIARKKNKDGKLQRFAKKTGNFI